MTLPAPEHVHPLPSIEKTGQRQPGVGPDLSRDNFIYQFTHLSIYSFVDEESIRSRSLESEMADAIGNTETNPRQSILSDGSLGGRGWC